MPRNDGNGPEPVGQFRQQGLQPLRRLGQSDLGVLFVLSTILTVHKNKETPAGAFFSLRPIDSYTCTPLILLAQATLGGWSVCLSGGDVAQWQSGRFISARSLVRIHPSPPISSCPGLSGCLSLFRACLFNPEFSTESRIVVFSCPGAHSPGSQPDLHERMPGHVLPRAAAVGTGCQRSGELFWQRAESSRFRLR